MPKFCRHGTLIESCPICHASVETAQRTAAQTAARRVQPKRGQSSVRARKASAAGAGRLMIRREVRAADDGFRSQLAPGLRATADAQRLVEELARATARLRALREAPPGLYLEVASEPDPEEASWLAFLIAYLGPLEADDPFATVRERRTSWASGGLPALDGAALGPRTAHDPSRGTATLAAYRRFAERFGSQANAYAAEGSWNEAQRFERLFERLALPGLHRRARFDLLVTLGALGRYPLRAGRLLLVEDDPVIRAAKRVFGIGDRLTLERRVGELATAAEIPVAAFDLGLENWAAAERVSQGVPGAVDRGASGRLTSALGL
jgi:uncharacterized Zn finger protein (UPF0148 family)